MEAEVNDQTERKPERKDSQGELSCVGVGMCLGAHISPVSQSFIEKADVCFVAVSDRLVEEWVFSMNSNCVSLQGFYQQGKSRNQTYADMIKEILAAVESGKKVCGVFYGHPGVFAYVPHEVIKRAKLSGYPTHMEPGISAEDCLYADLAIDPGRFGCQHFEASQFMLYHRNVDVGAHLVLWQVGVAGDMSLANFETSERLLGELVKVLAKDYPLTHQAIIYEARTTILDEVRRDEILLCELPYQKLNTYSTLVIPPAKPLKRNERNWQLLHSLQ